MIKRFINFLLGRNLSGFDKKSLGIVKVFDDTINDLEKLNADILARKAELDEEKLKLVLKLTNVTEHNLRLTEVINKNESIRNKIQNILS